MFNNTNTILLFLSIAVAFVVAITFIVRKAHNEYRIRKVRPTINHHYTEGKNDVIAVYTEENGSSIETILKKYDHELITDVCQFCNQVDHIHINSSYIQRLIAYNHKNIGIGELMVEHNDEHRITHYINVDNEYVSSLIPSVDLRNMEYLINEDEILGS